MSSLSLTSTTAPGKVFNSRSELAEHYKSDWHRYNLKRKESNLALLTESDFQVRLAAALAMKREKEQSAKHQGTSHLKQHKQKYKENERVVGVNAVNAKNKIEEESPAVIDPLQCLFSNQEFKSLRDNLEHMRHKYGFFIPEMEHLADQEGLVGYCHEKVKLGHCCLYCQKIFPTWRGTQQHMIDSRHCKLRYEEGMDLHEYEPFYDFDAANKEFLEHFNGPSSYTVIHKSKIESNDEIPVFEESSVADSDEWEDVDEDDEDSNDDVNMDDYYKDHVLKRGFDVTALGELVFPDGRVIGHRGLAKYYKQRYSANHTDSPAVSAYMRSLGIAPGQHLRGCGVLVPSQKITASGIGGAIAATDKGLSSYTTLSVYRYKAVIKKQRRQDNTGHRQFQKYYNRHNRFDKKGNRMMNGVSVAHAKR